MGVYSMVLIGKLTWKSAYINIQNPFWTRWKGNGKQMEDFRFADQKV